MSSLVFEIAEISDLALEIMKHAVDTNEQTGKINDDQSGPVALASAMSDFFQMASMVESNEQLQEKEVISDLAHYALDLIDRLQSQIWYLDIHNQRDQVSALFVSLSVWFARHNASLDNLKGAADGFALLVNGENRATELGKLSRLMDEVLQAASEEIQQDVDKTDQWRPWRMLNLNSGVAATRSFDPQLMQETFDKMEYRLPDDMPTFFSDGKRQVESQDVPEDVREIITRYADKWSKPTAH